MDLILLSLKMELDLSILKRIRLSWCGDLKPETPSLRPVEENTQTDFKPATQKLSGGNMAAFIYGNQKGGGRFVGNRKKHTIRGMKKK